MWFDAEFHNAFRNCSPIHKAHILIFIQNVIEVNFDLKYHQHCFYASSATASSALASAAITGAVKTGRPVYPV